MRRIIFLTVLMASAASAQESPPGGRAPPGPPERGGDWDGPGGDQRALFISPMGEPFRVQRPEKAWFEGADGNKDGRIDPAEFRADGARFFRLLDRQADGEIDPEDVDRYETKLVPEIRVPDGNGHGGSGGLARRGGPPSGGFGGGGPPGGGRQQRGSAQGDSESGPRPLARAGVQGAARYGYLDLPQPVTSADTNLNRGVDPAEFERAANQRFTQLGRNGDGLLAFNELPAIDTRLHRDRHDRLPGPPPGKRTMQVAQPETDD